MTTTDQLRQDLEDSISPKCQHPTDGGRCGRPAVVECDGRAGRMIRYACEQHAPYQMIIIGPVQVIEVPRDLPAVQLTAEGGIVSLVEAAPDEMPPQMFDPSDNFDES